MVLQDQRATLTGQVRMTDKRVKLQRTAIWPFRIRMAMMDMAPNHGSAGTI